MQNYNLIHDVQDISLNSPGLVEPVTVQEFKDYARLEGFVDDLASTADVSFTTDDDLIEELITASRESLEEYTGLALVPKVLRVTLTNMAGMVELPYGPTGDVLSLYYEWDDEYETNSANDVVLRGNEFKKLKTPVDKGIVISYSCGYGRGDTSNIPKRLKQAILMDVLYHYENRGEAVETVGLTDGAKKIAAPFSRKTFL